MLKFLCFALAPALLISASSYADTNAAECFIPEYSQYTLIRDSLDEFHEQVVFEMTEVKREGYSFEYNEETLKKWEEEGKINHFLNAWRPRILRTLELGPHSFETYLSEVQGLEKMKVAGRTYAEVFAKFADSTKDVMEKWQQNDLSAAATHELIWDTLNFEVDVEEQIGELLSDMYDRCDQPLIDLAAVQKSAQTTANEVIPGLKKLDEYPDEGPLSQADRNSLYKALFNVQAVSQLIPVVAQEFKQATAATPADKVKADFARYVFEKWSTAYHGFVWESGSELLEEVPEELEKAMFWAKHFRWQPEKSINLVLSSIDARMKGVKDPIPRCGANSEQWAHFTTFTRELVTGFFDESLHLYPAAHSFDQTLEELRELEKAGKLDEYIAIWKPLAYRAIDELQTELQFLSEIETIAEKRGSLLQQISKLSEESRGYWISGKDAETVAKAVSTMQSVQVAVDESLGETYNEFYESCHPE